MSDEGKPIQAGDDLVDRGQRYEVVGFVAHRVEDGQQIELAVLRSHCADCGVEFEVKRTARMPLESARGRLNRRCQKCKKPGKRVGGKRRWQ